MIKWKLIAALCAMTIASCGSAAQPISPPTDATRPRLVSGAITNMDYPAPAIRAREQGNVRIELDISADGAVTNCAVITSSGSMALDTATCAIARERFRFEPGRIADGTAAPSKYRQSVRWVLPDDGPGGDAIPFVQFRITTAATLSDGQIVACSSQSEGPSQPQAIQICQRTFGAWPIWESIRSRLSSATHVLAFTPQASAPLEHNAEWGSLHLQLDTNMVIGPDGRIRCEDPGQTGPQACRGDAPGLPLFERRAKPSVVA